jgi:extradiol dioxygenase family protein
LYIEIVSDSFKALEERPVKALRFDNFQKKLSNLFQQIMLQSITMFILDFSGNPIEFKAFKNPQEIFVSN